MTIPKQIDVKVTKPQNKHAHGRNKKCSVDKCKKERKIVLNYKCCWVKYLLKHVKTIYDHRY